MHNAFLHLSPSPTVYAEHIALSSLNNRQRGNKDIDIMEERCVFQIPAWVITAQDVPNGALEQFGSGP
ncbi:hypothetical protein CEP53_004660 [Fusarium sp. AF-6]|nr:hypothetical protein CEP53_004660 [Fusarium sp. AF-6]